MKDEIIKVLQEVYDPEFPMVDIWNLGLIYNIDIDNKKKHIHILMSLTTPACPMPDLLVELVQNAVKEKFSNYKVDVELTFEPLWSPEMIKDEDIKQMFQEE